MLAFYLAAPEVENDSRALTVTLGLRKAKREGKWSVLLRSHIRIRSQTMEENLLPQKNREDVKQVKASLEKAPI